MKLFYQVFKANFKEFIRDGSALFWFLAFPIIFVFIFGIVFSGQGEPNYNVGVISQQSAVNQQLINGLKQTPNFNINQGSRSEEMTALSEGKRQLVFELPSISYSDIQQGKQVEIDLYYDESRRQTGQILINVIRQMFNQVEREITGQAKMFEVVPHPVQAERISDFGYVLPGILAMALMQLGLFGGLQFLALRDKGIYRGLGVTPLPRTTLLGSEILLRLLMALVQTFLIVFLGQTIFGVKILGNIWQVTGLVTLGAMTFISLGFMLINFARTPESGQGIIQVVQFPMMFLSGIFFPIEFMPDYIKPVVKAIPLTYLGDALRQVMVGAVPEHSMQTNLLVLSSWLIVTFLVAVKFWRWE